MERSPARLKAVATRRRRVRNVGSPAVRVGLQVIHHDAYHAGPGAVGGHGRRSAQGGPPPGGALTESMDTTGERVDSSDAICGTG